MAAFADRKVIIGSVAKGPYSNLGNTLIERATLRCLGLPNETPMFSVFEPMTPQRAHTLNSFDLVVFTGCTLLQASEGHQRFLNAACDRISVPKLCFAGAFCAQLHDEPALEVARWFEAPTGAVPFSFEYVCEVLELIPGLFRKQLRVVQPNVLPTKQLRSVGRRQRVRSIRYARKCSSWQSSD